MHKYTMVKRTDIMMSDCVNSKVLFNDIPMYCKKIDLLYSFFFFCDNKTNTINTHYKLSIVIEQLLQHS